MSYVTFRYTDERLPPHRTVTMAAAKVHELAARAPVAITDGAETYLAFCDAHGHEPLATVEPDPDPEPAKVAPRAVPAPAEPEPSPEPEPQPDETGWPAGYTHERRGSMYDVIGPDGTAVGSARGERAAIELATTHRDAASAHTATGD